MQIEIEPRKIRFNIDKALPRYWNANCPVMTHVFNAIAILAPAFERLAITSVLVYQKSISDPFLARQVKGFIGQESAHGSEFIRFNQILRSQGYDVKTRGRKNVMQFKSLAKRFSPIMHLSLTLAAEHLTAILSYLLLREENWLNSADKKCADLWRWHAQEEIEHKAVAFDVFKAAGGTYFTRVIGMFMMSSMMMYLLISNFIYLASRDKLLRKLSFWKTLFTVTWGKKGLMRKLMIPWCYYFKPSFHPWRNSHYVLTH